MNGTRRRVWRYAVPVTGEPVALDMPLSPRLLVAARNPDSVEVWMEAEVDDQLLARNTVPRLMVVVPTGGAVPDRAWHVGSTLAADGQLVWHLYELPARDCARLAPPAGQNAHLGWKPPADAVDGAA